MDANDRRARATEEAAHWWGRLGTQPPANVSEMDRQEFTQWLRESPLHVAELLQVAHVHDTLERFQLWDEISGSTDDVDASVIPLTPLSALEPKDSRSRDFRPGGGRARFLLAASVALIAIAAAWLALRSGPTTIETDRAERREVVLGDGSVVNLEPETALRMDIGKHERFIVLTHGRALFHVAKDPTRPFIVHAGDTRVRAVGTIFGVEQKNQNIIVTVSEGKVGVVPTSQLESAAARSANRVGGETSAAHTGVRGDDSSVNEALSSTFSGSSSSEPGEVFLSANQQITVRKTGDATPVQKVDSTRALAWSEGRLVFDSTPLSDVADEFNRYNRVQLQINGPDLARRTVSGVFRASDPETLIDFIGAGAHVVVTRKGNGEIVISPGP